MTSFFKVKDEVPDRLDHTLDEIRAIQNSKNSTFVVPEGDQLHHATHGRRFYYLASPYSHPDTVVVQHRYALALRAAATLWRTGIRVFCPIVHCHVINQAMGNHASSGSTEGLGWEYYSEFDLHMVAACGMVLVLKMDGWDQSIGVKAEIEYAVKNDLPVLYLQPELLNPVN